MLSLLTQTCEELELLTVLWSYVKETLRLSGLPKDRNQKRDAFYEFKNKKLTADVLDELNYQFLRRLQKEGLITLKSLFIDGTKIEANANRYTFVWRGTLNYHLAGYRWIPLIRCIRNIMF